MPTPRDFGNVLALGAALGLSSLLGILAWPRNGPAPALQAATAGPGSLPAAGDLPGVMVPGTDGVSVASGDYQRIISLDPAIDDAVVQLGLTTRLLAISDWSRAHSASARALAQVPGHAPAGVSVEALTRLRPDLVLIGASSDADRTALARAAGLRLFAASGDGTAADAAASVQRLGRLLDASALGDLIAARFLRRITHAADPHLPRLSACYCSSFSGKIFGGTTGTSFHDLLVYAGFQDCAATHGWRGWPEYHLEDLILLAPMVIVTSPGAGAVISALPGSARVPAVASGRILELDEDSLSRTGLGLLESIEALVDAREHLP